MRKFIVGVAAAGLMCGGLGSASPALAVPFPQGCGDFFQAPCEDPSNPAPKPATQSDPNGVPYWWEDSSGRHWCPPECLTR